MRLTHNGEPTYVRTLPKLHAIVDRVAGTGSESEPDGRPGGSGWSSCPPRDAGSLNAGGDHCEWSAEGRSQGFRRCSGQLGRVLERFAHHPADLDDRVGGDGRRRS